MLRYYRKLSLFNKAMILSFCIIFIVVNAVSGIGIIVQSKTLKIELTEQVEKVVSLWSTAINQEDLKDVIANQDATSESYKRIYEKLSLVEGKNSSFFHAAVIDFSPSSNTNRILVGSRGCELLGIHPFSNLDAPNTYIDRLEKTKYLKSITSTDLYENDHGTWISAFSPIISEDGEVLAILVVNANSSIIDSFQSQMAYYLLILLLIVSFIFFFIFRKGLRIVFQPVEELMYGIKEVSNGNFQIKLQTKDQSDLGSLIKRFNDMTTQLTFLFEQLTLTSEQLGSGQRQNDQKVNLDMAIGEMDEIFKKTKLLKELQRAEKMNAIGQLAASVAHEIRNPMTVVKGFLQIFLSKDQLSKEEHMYIRLMIDEMNRAETIINDYLSLAKPDLENIELVNASDLGLKVLDLMNSYALMSKNIEMEKSIEKDLFVKGNSGELKQVLINMLKNGIEAMKDGGILTLKVYKDQGSVVFEITDTGIGMTQEEIERLGTAFYSLKEKGTGMGLMVCYQIIERMKGRIEVESEKNVGTSFRIILPLEC